VCRVLNACVQYLGSTPFPHLVHGPHARSSSKKFVHHKGENYIRSKTIMVVVPKSSTSVISLMALYETKNQYYYMNMRAFGGANSTKNLDCQLPQGDMF
jgi:hypothetical protein